MNEDSSSDLFLPEQPLPSEAEPSTDASPHTAAAIRAARLCVLVAAVLWSTSGFFVKSPALEGWKGPRLAFWRAAFAMIALLPFVRRPRFALSLVPMAAMFVGMNYTYLTAMVRGSAANAIWLQSTAPVWVLLVGVFVFGERAGWRDWFMVLCAATGIGIIVFFEWDGDRLDAVVWALTSGLFYAGVVLSLRQLRGFNSVWLAVVNHAVTAIALLPYAVGEGKLPGGIQWIMLAAFGVLQMGLPYVLFAHGLRQIPGHEATAIGLIEPLLNPTWVFLAWGDQPAWWTVVGGGFILLGLAVRYMWPARPKPH